MVGHTANQRQSWDELIKAALARVLHTGHRMPVARLAVGTIANEKRPPATTKEHVGPEPSHRSSLEANLMTSAHFFQTHPSSLSQNLSVFGPFPCREAKAGLRALEGAPSERLFSAPTPFRPPSWLA